MNANFVIQASELLERGVNPNQWAALPMRTKKALASDILNTRGNSGEAFLIESNNPNALAQLILVWDL